CILPTSSPLTQSFHNYYFTAPPTAYIYTLSLHDALPISFALKHWPAVSLRPSSSSAGSAVGLIIKLSASIPATLFASSRDITWRSEEHTSELQSLRHLVCRLLLEKKKHLKNLPIIVNLIV